MPDARYFYYSTMLTGQGRGICHNVDDAMGFWLLAADQIRFYMTRKVAGEPFVDFEITENAKEFLPEEELFPRLRKQVVTFDD